MAHVAKENIPNVASSSSASHLQYLKSIGSGTMILVSLLWLTLLPPAWVAAEDFRSYNILPSISDVRKLKVGQELFTEQLALNRGQCIYVLEGLELPKSYEVKISYPASIPASFTIELLKEGSFQATRGGRRLLNTEKLMFRADESQGAEIYDDMLSAHVLVTVEPASVVAMPHTKDHTFAVFNILCEEVKFGIPRQAWWIGLLGAVAVLISAVAPMLLPRHLLPRKGKEPHRRGTSQGKMQIENELNPVHGM
eukprot:c18754_g1_i2 orf=532-1290(+)